MATHDALATVADGDTLQDGYFNDMKLRLKKFIFSSAAEEETTSATFVTLKTGTLTPLTANNIVLGCDFSFDSHITAGSNGHIRIQINSETVVDITENSGSFATHTGTFKLSAMVGTSYTVNVDAYKPSAGTSTQIRNVVINVYVLDFNGGVDSESPAFS